MRLPILVYGVLYVVLEMVGHQLEAVGWNRVTSLHIAAALVDAFLAVVLAIAGVVAVDLGRRRWGSVIRPRQEQRLRPSDEPLDPIEVPSWRAGSGPFAPPPRAIAAPVASRGGTYGPPDAGRRRPDDPGRLL